MSHAFRELLRKIGSGPHTGENLTREEAAAATCMMLRQEATPAQIGAFMIAHRIRRPTGAELAGMLDAYEELGPQLQSIAAAYPVTVLGIPYDGRTRTAPISPLTALILATAGCPVILHGGDRMPTKEGEPLIHYWQGLGVDWSPLSMAQVQTVFAATGLGFVYLPTHFPLAQGLVPYREQIGKRPPFATMELIWSPYRGDAHVVAGFVHPPTEAMFEQALQLRGISTFTTVKGLEGSGDLPRDRTAIIGLGHFPDALDEPRSPVAPLERLHLATRDYGFESKNVPLEPVAALVPAMHAVINGQPSDLMQSALWNGGFYLWRCGACPSIETGIAQAQALLTQGQVRQKLEELQQATAQVVLSGVAE